jgi:hypothetical protein
VVPKDSDMSVFDSDAFAYFYLPEGDRNPGSTPTPAVLVTKNLNIKAIPGIPAKPNFTWYLTYWTQAPYDPTAGVQVYRHMTTGT